MLLLGIEASDLFTYMQYMYLKDTNRKGQQKFCFEGIK